MPITSAHHSCAFCPAAACDITCERCGNRVCLEHIPLGNRRCEGCEYLYIKRRDTVRTGAWFLVPFLAVWPVFISLASTIMYMPNVGAMRGISTGVPIVDAFIIALLVAFGLGKLSVGARMFIHRRQFLAETGAARSSFTSRGDYARRSRIIHVATEPQTASGSFAARHRPAADQGY